MQRRQKQIRYGLVSFGVVCLYNYAFLMGKISSSLSLRQRNIHEEMAPGKGSDFNSELQRNREKWREMLNNGTSLVGFHTFTGSKIDRIVLIGERHSGTTFFTKLLKSCFPDIQVQDSFVVGKHWFQPHPDHVRHVLATLDTEELRARDILSWASLSQGGAIEDAFHSTLVLALFRNPYEWCVAKTSMMFV